jgi:hypothetical protein
MSKPQLAESLYAEVIGKMEKQGEMKHSLVLAKNLYGRLLMR